MGLWVAVWPSGKVLFSILTLLCDGWLSTCR